MTTCSDNPDTYTPVFKLSRRCSTDEEGSSRSNICSLYISRNEHLHKNCFESPCWKQNKKHVVWCTVTERHVKSQTVILQFKFGTTVSIQMFLSLIKPTPSGRIILYYNHCPFYCHKQDFSKGRELISIMFRNKCGAGKYILS